MNTHHAPQDGSRRPSGRPTAAATADTADALEQAATDERYQGEDAPELPAGTVLLPAKMKELAVRHLSGLERAKETAKEARELKSTADGYLLQLVEAAGEDATRILFEGSDLAINIDRTTKLKAWQGSGDPVVSARTSNADAVAAVRRFKRALPKNTSVTVGGATLNGEGPAR